MTIHRDLEGFTTVVEPLRPRGGRPRTRQRRPATPNVTSARRQAMANAVLDGGRTREQVATEYGLARW
jgi:hypothetical protein